MLLQHSTSHVHSTNSRRQPRAYQHVAAVAPGSLPAQCFPAASSSPLQLVPNRHQRARRATVRQQAAAPILANLPLDRDLDEPLPGFDSIGAALEDLAAGKFLVVLDDENRENEGDLIMAADRMTTESMAFLVEYSSGVVCIGMEGKDLERLRLPLMINSAENEESMYTAFTVTVDLRDGTSTGISASDRSKTIRALADPNTTAKDFRRPGHIFPLRYRRGGVIVRPGHTEASVDLARLAGCYPAGALCEIVSKADGSMARTPELMKFAKEHGLKCITIADLIRYRLKHEHLVQHTATAQMDTQHGKLTVHTYRSTLDDSEHVVFVAGQVAGQQGVLTYVQPEQAVADLVGATNSSSLNDALQSISAAGCGAVVYMRGVSAAAAPLTHEVEARASSSGASGAHIDLRTYGLAAQMLRHAGVQSVQLATQDKQQLSALRSCGIKVVPAAQSTASANGVVRAFAAKA